MRKYLNIILFLSLISLLSINTLAEKEIKLSLELATVIAEKQDVIEGLKKFERDDLMLNLIGEYEKLWTGQLDGDAYITQAGEKIKKVIEITQSISEFATKLGQGNCDEALFASIDATVNIVDHPVVKVTWAACKLTYESHKQVQETGAQLEIEQLYNIVNRDRMLVGVQDPKENQPKLIPENSETVDYFFNKYLITDDRVRGLVKTYVKKVLGEEWPEQTWSQWLLSWKTIGSSVDTKKSDEIEALATEFKNTARRWIMLLIKDLNKQVKVAWAQARLRQEMAEFQNFASRLSVFEKDLPRLFEEFKQRKKYRAELPKYKEYLANSPKVLEEVKINLNDPKKRTQVLSTISLWKQNLIYSYSASRLIGEKELSQALEQQWKTWLELEKEFNKKLYQLDKEVQENPSVVIPDTKSGIDSYETHFKRIVIPFSSWVEGGIENAKAKVLEEFNKGNFEGANDIITKWYQQKEDINRYYAELENKILKVNIPGEDVAKGKDLAIRTFKELKIITEQIYERGNTELNDIRVAFSELKTAKWQQWDEYSMFVRSIVGKLGKDVIYGKSSDEIYDLLKGLDSELKKREERFYHGISKFDKSIKLEDLEFKMKNLLDDIEIFKGTSEFLTYDWNSYFVRWLSAESEWKNTKKLTEKELLEIKVLVKPNNFDEIQEHVNFIEKRISELPSLISKIEDKLNQLKQLVETDTENREKDIELLRKNIEDWKKFRTELKERLKLETGIENMAIVNTPFPHYITEKELQEYSNNLKTTWEEYSVIKFLKKYAPAQYELIMELQPLKNIKCAKEENLILPYISKVVWKSDLNRAELLLDNAMNNVNNTNFYDLMYHISKLTYINYETIVRKAGKSQDEVQFISFLEEIENDSGKTDYLNYPIWQQYLRIFSKIKKLKELVDKYEKDQERKRIEDEEDKKRIIKDIQLIKDFYNNFKTSYESKNDSQVMSLLSDEWSAGDGTTLSDLQENLRNSFSVFNEINFNISNLNIEKTNDGKYKVSYNVTITGRIYENNIKHEEKSSVSELLIVDSTGKVKIYKTLSGRFWYIE